MKWILLQGLNIKIFTVQHLDIHLKNRGFIEIYLKSHQLRRSHSSSFCSDPYLLNHVPFLPTLGKFYLLVQAHHCFSSNQCSAASFNPDKITRVHLKFPWKLHENVAPRPSKATDLNIIRTSVPINRSNLHPAAKALKPRLGLRGQIHSHSQLPRPISGPNLPPPTGAGRLVLTADFAGLGPAAAYADRSGAMELRSESITSVGWAKRITQKDPETTDAGKVVVDL